MRCLFVLLFLWGLTAAQSENLNENLTKSVDDYFGSLKTLSNTLLTTPDANITVKPDISRAEKVPQMVESLCSKCKNSDFDDDKATRRLDKILSEVTVIDQDLQKMGTFENSALNMARINAIQQSNALMAWLVETKEKSVCETLSQAEEADAEDADETDAEEQQSSDDETNADSDDDLSTDTESSDEDTEDEPSEDDTEEDVDE